MWGGALYVVGGAIAAVGVWTFGFGAGQRNGRLNCALWTVAAAVLWPVLLLGVVEVMVDCGCCVVCSTRPFSRAFCRNRLVG